MVVSPSEEHWTFLVSESESIARLGWTKMMTCGSQVSVFWGSLHPPIKLYIYVYIHIHIYIYIYVYIHIKTTVEIYIIYLHECGVTKIAGLGYSSLTGISVDTISGLLVATIISL